MALFLKKIGRTATFTENKRIKRMNRKTWQRFKTKSRRNSQRERRGGKHKESLKNEISKEHIKKIVTLSRIQKNKQKQS